MQVIATDSEWGSETPGTMLTFYIDMADAPTWVYYPGSVYDDTGESYSATLNATAVSGSVTFSASDLPPGISLSGSTISGTFETFGNYTATITATDSSYGSSSIEYINFNIDPFRKKCLLEGLDDIALTLEKSEKFYDYELKLSKTRPWITK